MAKQQQFANGTEVQFAGYEEGAEGGVLRKGSTIEITGFDPEQALYNVKGENGEEDSLFAEEFAEVTKEKSKPKPKAKVKAKVVPTEEPTKEETKEETEEETETDSALPKYKATASVSAALKDSNGDALKAAHTLAEQEAKTEFTLGGILAKIKRGNLQTKIDSDQSDEGGNPIPRYSEDLGGFNGYVKDELGLHDRKAHSLINIYEKFSQITTEVKLAKVGWTKLRELLPLTIDSDNVAEWLTKAGSLTTSELHESVKSSLVEGGEKVHGNQNLVKQVRFNFIAFEDQAEMWEQAISLAKEVIGEDQSNSMALNHIITEWSNLAFGEEGKEVAA